MNTPTVGRTRKAKARKAAVGTHSPCIWPFDPESAKTIECHAVIAPRRATLYVWKQDHSRYWQYTMDAGANSERSMSGCIPIAPSLLDVQGAIDAAVVYCKRYRVWFD